jgi:WD40 repeat protein
MVMNFITLTSPFWGYAAKDSIRLSDFLEDARRFVLANRFIGDIAPLQLYSSAIVFAPQTSVVRKFVAKYQHGLKQCPITPVKWGLEPQKLEGHDSYVNAAAFSHDGSLLASASGDRTVRLWNPTTGERIAKTRWCPIN